ncbi:bacteriocin-like protein [Chryseobacterium sediminis]
MKNLKKISKEKLRGINGGQKVCLPGQREMHCPNSPIPQCYWQENTMECPDF